LVFFYFKQAHHSSNLSLANPLENKNSKTGIWSKWSWKCCFNHWKHLF
jgi:hypothetical protein